MQYEFMGVSVQKTGFYVCPTCLDQPNPQLAAINPPPDPLPIPLALPPAPNTEGYTTIEND